MNQNSITTALRLAGVILLLSSASSTARLVSYWNFDTDASDATGAHAGQLIGSAAISTGNVGFGGGEALQLSVEGAYLDLADPTTFDFNSDFTWHARIKTADGSGAIFSRNPNRKAWNQGSKALFVRNNNVDWDTGWVSNPHTNVAVNDNAWHTVIATYNSASDRLNIFVDPAAGATNGQFSGTHDVNRFDEHTFLHNDGLAHTSFTIGKADFSGGLASLDTLIGLIDDAAVFDTELTGADLDNLIVNGPAGFLPKPPVNPHFTVSTDGVNLVFNWDSKAGEVYNILGDADMAPNDPSQWAPFQSGINATPPTNTLVVAFPASPRMFFVLENLGVPPVFQDDFETDTGWTMGSDDQPGTVWGRGAPSVVGPPAAFSGTNCYGTNLSSDYTLNTDVWLRSPPIDLTNGAFAGATLKFQQFKDIETEFDFGRIRVLDAATNLPLGTDVASRIDGVSAGWGSFSAILPPESLGKMIKIEFRLDSDELVNAAGWYIDDVVVLPN